MRRTAATADNERRAVLPTGNREESATVSMTVTETGRQRQGVAVTAVRDEQRREEREVWSH